MNNQSQTLFDVIQSCRYISEPCQAQARLDVVEFLHQGLIPASAEAPPQKNDEYCTTFLGVSLFSLPCVFLAFSTHTPIAWSFCVYSSFRFLFSFWSSLFAFS